MIMEDVAIYVVILLVHSTVIVGKVIHCIQMEKNVLVGYIRLCITKPWRVYTYFLPF